MVVVSLLPHEEFGRNNHRENALHFSARYLEILRELNLSNTFGPEYKLTNKTIEAFAQCKNIQVRGLFTKTLFNLED